jgi:hypothetical protein
MNKLDEEMSEINQKKSELESSLQFHSNDFASKHIINLLIKQAPIKAITKAILTEFVQQIDVNEDGKVHIRYTIPLLNIIYQRKLAVNNTPHGSSTETYPQAEPTPTDTHH